MSLWGRIARLIRQSRIRLPAEPISAAELRPGDWVQIGSERWQVTTRRFESDRVVFRLRPRLGTAGVSLPTLLTAPRDTAGMWTLEHGGSELSVPRELLVVFPVV